MVVQEMVNVMDLVSETTYINVRYGELAYWIDDFLLFG